MSNIIFSDWYKDFQDNFIEWGYDNLHILADFDRTLTKNFVDGEEKPSLVSVLRREWILWEDYSKQAYDLFNYYHPFEISHTLSSWEKKKYMDEWWHKHMQLLVDTWIQKSDISEALSLWKVEFRDGIKIFLEFLESHNIPLVIISANALWTDSIRAFFQIQWFSTDNIYIISNEFEWNTQWKAIRYKKPVIHVFNKDETILSSFPDISNKISDRKNVILLWDSEGDPGMIEWFDADNLLKVWFLNKNKEELEQRYRQLYDVVICDDGNFDFINTFLENIK